MLFEHVFEEYAKAAAPSQPDISSRPVPQTSDSDFLSAVFYIPPDSIDTDTPSYPPPSNISELDRYLAGEGDSVDNSDALDWWKVRSSYVPCD